MAISNLRTGITFIQERNTVSPNIQATSLPVVLVGLNRDLFFHEPANIFDWSAGTAAADVAFPGYTSGRVEAGITNPTLAPKFFVRNTLGLADITSHVTLNNLGTGTPSFSIASGFSAVFEIATGTAGCFAVDTGDEVDSTFTDLGADFVFSRVRRGDVIKVSGVDEYAITSVVSDSELTVRRIGKGPESISASEAAKMHLSAETAEDLRTLTVNSASFAAAGGFGQSGTRVKGGDLLNVGNWDIKFGSEGIQFSTEGELVGTILASHTITAVERTVLFPASTTITVSPFVPTTGVGTAIFLVNSQDEFVPSFYAVTAKNGSDAAVVKTYAAAPLVPASDSDAGDAYKAITYTAFNAGSSTGSFSARAENGTRTFTDTVGSLPALTGGDIVEHILIPDINGVYRPMFRVVSKASNVYTVEEFTTSELSAGALANNVTYKILSYDSSESTEFEQSSLASVTVTYEEAAPTYTASSFANYALTAQDRILTLAGATFNTEDVAAGDLIFNHAGVLLFKVMATPTGATDNTKLVVQLATNAGEQLLSTATLSNLGFTVRDGSANTSFVVRRVISDTSLEVKAIGGTTMPGTTSVNGFIYFQAAGQALPTSVTVGDSVVGVSYSIHKTVTGANLDGDILVNYAVVKDNLVGIQEITAANYADILGDDVVDNPLGLAARIYFSNSSNTVYAVQVHADTDEGWLAAAEAVKTDRVYNIVPLTQTESVLAMWRAHVIEQSLPTNKRERILWQAHLFLQDVVKATWLITDNALVSRDVDGVQTVSIDRDLVALGVVIGDNFTGTWFNGVSDQTVSGRITDVDLAGSTTTLTMLPDGSIATETSDTVISSYVIESRPLTIAELKNEVKAYPGTITERRIRNIYPDRCRVVFSDDTGDGETTGVYGGGTVIADAGGFYYCVVEAAKRTAYGPATPLTKRGGAGIYQVLDTFAEAPGFQDEIIDAGNYYMQQSGGLGSNVSSIRALTTDTRELITAEESVTPQIDSFVRRLRAQLTPLLGPEILDRRFFDLLSTTAQATVTRILADKQMKDIQLLSIQESPDTADTFLMKYAVQPYFSGARGIVTILF